MARDHIEEQLLGFIAASLLDEEPRKGDDPLAMDAVDSLGLEQLVIYIEREFGIAIPGEEMVRKNFGSIPALAALIESKQANRLMGR